MQDIKKIFLGRPKKRLSEIIYNSVEYNKNKFKKLVIPCVGSFFITRLLNKLNFQKIITSDITLFSSVLGIYLSNRDPRKELELQFLDPFFVERINESKDVDEWTATLLYLIGICRFNPTNYYVRDLITELKRNYETNINNIKNFIITAKKEFNGKLEYRIKDMFDELNEHKNDDCLLFINPPTYRGGYVKMWNFEGKIRWLNEPKIEQFDKSQNIKLLNILSNIKPKIILHLNIDNIFKEDEDEYTARKQLNETGCYELSEKRREYILTNFDTSKYIVSKMLNDPFYFKDVKKYPIFNDDEIWKGSKIDIMKVDKKTAEYYRNVFLHRLGMTGAGNNFLLFIDGKVLTAFGLDLSKLFKGGMDIYEMYGLTTNSNKYNRLGRLFLRLIISKDFKDYILRNYPKLELYNLKGIKTTSLTRLGRSRLDRGLFKLVEKKKLPNNMWYLQYRTDFVDKSFRQMVVEYLDEHNKKEVKDGEDS